MNHKNKDSIIGSLVLGAIGDAMGRPYEGKPNPIVYAEHSPWKITDDTQFIMATSESIIENSNISPEKIALSYSKWYKAKRFTSVGSSTLKALRDLSVGAHWALSGAQGERSAGNGAARRIAPLAFFLDPNIQKERQLIRDVCRITHHNDEAYIGALAIIYSIQTKNPNDLLADLILNLPDSNVRDKLIEYSKLPPKKNIGDVAKDLGTSGYVSESVPFSIYTAIQSSKAPIEETMIKIIEAGGDTDTTASMTGNLLGSWLGFKQISESTYSKIPNVEKIISLGNSLHELTLNYKFKSPIDKP